MASFTQNTDVNWLACSSMPLMCASIPVSQTPTHFSNRTKRSIHGNRSQRSRLDLNDQAHELVKEAHKEHEMVSRSVCASIFPSIVSIFASALIDTSLGEQSRGRLSEDHALVFYSPHLSHISDTSQCTPLTLPFHSHCCLRT